MSTKSMTIAAIFLLAATLASAQPQPATAAQRMRRHFEEGNRQLLEMAQDGAKPGRGEKKDFEPWMSITEHSAEHYGLLVAYYRANGLAPPASRPKSK
jgi:hypothetical protein